MQTLSDVEYLDCVICLHKRQIQITCCQCKVCNICGPCGNDLVESGQMNRCPTCRLISPWIYTTEFEIQEPFSPHASRDTTPIHTPPAPPLTLVRPASGSLPAPAIIENEPPPSLMQSACAQLYKYNICYCIICIIYVAFEIILGILKVVLKILNNENVKRFILLSVVSYIFGLLIIVIATCKSPGDLPPHLVSWIPLLIGISLLSGPIYKCILDFNARHNEQTIPTLFQQTREQHRHAYTITDPQASHLIID